VKTTISLAMYAISAKVPFYLIFYQLQTRDGLKFDKCSVQLCNIWLFGWGSAELRQKFGVIYGFALQRFVLAADSNLKSLYLLLVTS